MSADKNFYNTEMFESDEDANYANFLCVDSEMNPSASTQLPDSRKKFIYKQYVDKENRAPNQPVTLQKTVTTSMPPTLNFVIKTQQEHGNMIRVLLREVKLLRRELMEERQKKAAPQNSPSVTLEIPVASADEFLKLEADIKQDNEKEKHLINLFNMINDQNLEKFIRGCLKLILSIKAATSYTWYGRHGNRAVEQFKLMSLIIDCAGNKYPTSKISERVHVIKRWFLYAKDIHNKCKIQDQPNM